MSETSITQSSNSAVSDDVIPSHVPRHLVRDDLSFVWGSEPNDNEDPFYQHKLLLSEDVPRVFYTTDAKRFLFRDEGIWAFTRYEDIKEIYQNAELFSTEGVAAFQRMVGEDWPMIPLGIDPPEHWKYRALLNPMFSPQAMTKMEGSVRQTAKDLIDEFAAKGECDYTVDFARPYPVKIFLTLMGLPFSEYLTFLEWEFKILHTSDTEVRVEGVRAALAYLREFIKERKANPSNDLASHIIHGKIDGRPLTEDEIMGTVFFLFIGGLDTVAATLSLIFRRLALHPEWQKQLRENFDLIPEAVEEFLRTNPLVNSFRLVTKDTELAGVDIKKGDYVLCLNVSGNFDPDVFENPDDINFQRQGNRHFSLAGGAHRCLGSHLARRELRFALEEWFKQIPDFRIKEGADVPAYPGLISVPSLPLVWDTGQ